MSATPARLIAYRFFAAFFLAAFFAFFAILPPKEGVVCQAAVTRCYYGWPEHSTLIQDVDYG
jgi:hypothetical protein